MIFDSCFQCDAVSNGFRNRNKFRRASARGERRGPKPTSTRASGPRRIFQRSAMK